MKTPEKAQSHTPIPWTWGRFDDELHIVPARGEVIAKVCFRNSVVGALPAEANSDFIVRAVGCGPEDHITCEHVRRENDVSDSQSDYSAGCYYDNLTQAIRAAERNIGYATAA